MARAGTAELNITKNCSNLHERPFQINFSSNKLNEFFSFFEGFQGKNFSEKNKQKIIEKLKSINSYPNKIKTYIEESAPKENIAWFYTLNGEISRIDIKLYQPSFMLKDIKQASSSLRKDNKVIVGWVKIWLTDIDNLKKGVLTFEQIETKLTSRYGNPTRKDTKNIYITNWKNGAIDIYKPSIWEDKNIRLTLTASPDKPFYERNYYGRQFIYPPNLIFIKIENTSPVLTNLFEQAYELFELEETILLKKRVEEMAEIERKRAKEIKEKIVF